MEITFPRKKNIKTAGDKAIYVVLGRGGLENQGDEFWIMDFWELPYTFNRYDNARIGARTILAKMKEYEWYDPEVIIAKVII